jgi:toxin secretion/phage lysis holin
MNLLIAGLTHPLGILIIMTLIDTLFGIAKGFKQGKLSSNIGKVGLLVNSGVILLVTVVYLVISHFNPVAYGFPAQFSAEIFGFHMMLTPVILANIFAYLFVWNQVISIIENLSDLGVKMPKIISQVVDTVNDRLDGSISKSGADDSGEQLEFDEDGNLKK